MGFFATRRTKASKEPKVHQQALIWLYEKVQIMIENGWPEYPVQADAALFIASVPNAVQLSYSELESTLRSIHVQNGADQPVTIDAPDGRHYSVRFVIEDNRIVLRDAKLVHA